MFHSVQTHNRRSMATLVATLALTASFLVVGPSGADAQSSSPAKKLLVGSWLETVTFPPEFGRPPLKSLEQLSRRWNHVLYGSRQRHHGSSNGIQRMPRRLDASGQPHFRLHRLRAHLGPQRKPRGESSSSGGTYTVSTSGAGYEGTTFAEISGYEWQRPRGGDRHQRRTADSDRIALSFSDASALRSLEPVDHEQVAEPPLDRSNRSDCPSGVITTVSLMSSTPTGSDGVRVFQRRRTPVVKSTRKTSTAGGLAPSGAGDG